MKLAKLTLHNFKGIKGFELNLDGDVAVYGDNGTGKTTLADAWFWLLFGKDSLNRSDFEIKTLDANGVAISGIDHEVEGVLEIEGKHRTLKKVYSENWTKKRGSAAKEFTGHTTNYFLDGVPVKKGEYELFIAHFIDEDAFKLLTNPRHFNESLHWQERRRILLNICGDIADADVISSDERLIRLPDILGSHTLEEHRKVILAKKATINKQLQELPIRVSEVQRGLPEESNSASKRLDVMLPTELTRLKEERSKKSQELATLEAGGAIAQKTKDQQETAAEMVRVKKEHWMETTNATQAAKAEMRRLQDEYAELAFSLNTMERDANSLNSRIITERNGTKSMTTNSCMKIPIPVRPADKLCLRSK